MSSNPTWVAVERCQLCDKTRKNFSCRNCIKEGNFYSTKNNEVRYDNLSNLHCVKMQKCLNICCCSPTIFLVHFLRSMKIS